MQGFPFLRRVAGAVFTLLILAACSRPESITLATVPLSGETPVAVEGKLSRCGMGWRFWFSLPEGQGMPESTVDVYLENRGDQALTFTPRLNADVTQPNGDLSIAPGASAQVFSGTFAELHDIGYGMDMNMWFGTTLEREVKFKLRIVPHLSAGQKANLAVGAHHPGQGL